MRLKLKKSEVALHRINEESETFVLSGELVVPNHYRDRRRRPLHLEDQCIRTTPILWAT